MDIPATYKPVIMKTNSPSSNLRPAKAVFIYKLYLLLFAFCVCYSNNLSARVKPRDNYIKKHIHLNRNAASTLIKAGNTAHSKGTKKAAAFALPVISYSGPQTYLAGTIISPLSPTSSGVAMAAYSNSPVTLGSGFNHPYSVALDATGNIYVA